MTPSKSDDSIPWFHFLAVKDVGSGVETPKHHIQTVNAHISCVQERRALCQRQAEEIHDEDLENSSPGHLLECVDNPELLTRGSPDLRG